MEVGAEPSPTCMHSMFSNETSKAMMRKVERGGPTHACRVENENQPILVFACTYMTGVGVSDKKMLGRAVDHSSLPGDFGRVL